MFRYETHLHTSPVSKCAHSTVRETLEFYARRGYDGVFITNHFIDGNINVSPELSYEDRIRFYFSDYEEGVRIGQELGIKVFCGVEMSYLGTDFLVWGLDQAWYLAHPEIEKMKKSEELPFLMSEGALVVQAHPYREANYIDHIRLFPRCVEGVEVVNGNRKPLENEMALAYANAYRLLRTAGTDNHSGPRTKHLAGMAGTEPLESVADFIAHVRAGDMELFYEIHDPE